MDNANMQEVLLFATAIAPFATALVQLIKATITVKTNFLPAISVLVGILLAAVAFPFTDLDLPMRLWAGLIGGLSGTGLYETFIAKRPGTTDNNE